LLFDLKPKTKREELFGRQRELDNLLSSMMKYPLTLIAGVRRIGKTSLLKTALGECTHPVMYLDARRLEEEGYTRQALYRAILRRAFKCRWLMV